MEEEVAEGIHVLSMDLPKGFSVNILVVLDEEPVVIDCGPVDCAFDLLEEVKGVVPWEEILFLALTSTRPEHLPGIGKFLAALSNVRVLALGHPEMRERLRVLAVGRPVWFVKDGEFVRIGKRRLRFISLPLPVAPEMAGILVEPERVFFSSDLGASFDSLKAGEPSEEGLRRAVKELLRPGAGEGGGSVEGAIEKVLSLRPSLLVPAHGPICRSSIKGRLKRWLEGARQVSG